MLGQHVESLEPRWLRDEGGRREHRRHATDDVLPLGVCLHAADSIEGPQSRDTLGSGQKLNGLHTSIQTALCTQ